MHRADGLEMARQAPATRISMPFFLYPDGDGSGSLIETVTCVVDGTRTNFTVPSSGWTQGYTRNNVGNTYVGALREGKGLIPFNGGESRAASIYWNWGAGIDQ